MANDFLALSTQTSFGGPIALQLYIWSHLTNIIYWGDPIDCCPWCRFSSHILRMQSFAFSTIVFHQLDIGL